MQQHLPKPFQDRTREAPIVVAGADGCRAGWVLATHEELRVVPRLDRAEIDGISVLGVDMPIGLPIDARRACDVEARRALGLRGSSVFPTPPRACLGTATHAAAVERARAAFGSGISIQAFHLLPKIAEVDALVDPREPDRVIEVHPELSFATMRRLRTGDLSPLPRKAEPAGLTARRQLLAREGIEVRPTPRGAKPDDVLDAYAVLWSAERFARGDALVLGDGSRDARGLPMRIIA